VAQKSLIKVTHNQKSSLNVPTTVAYRDTLFAIFSLGLVKPGTHYPYIPAVFTGMYRALLYCIAFLPTRRYASAGISCRCVSVCVCVSVCLSVGLSVTRRYCIEVAARIELIFCIQISVL